jgi:hypothetical protein
VRYQINGEYALFLITNFCRKALDRMLIVLSHIGY